MNRIAVYCGSATPADPVYMETARAVGRGLAERGIGVVFGGGKKGLMGALADSERCKTHPQLARAIPRLLHAKVLDATGKL